MKVYRIVLTETSVEFIRSMYKPYHEHTFKSMTASSKIRLAQVMKNCSFETFCSTSNGGLIPLFTPNREDY